MPFCKFCGNQLEDGELCTCEEAVEEARKAAENVSANAQEVTGKIQQTADVPVETPAYSDSMSHNSSDAAAAVPDDSTFKKGLGMLGAGLAAVILLIVLLVMLFSGAGYKTPLKKLVKGINKCDAELIMSAMVTEEQIDEAREDAEDEDIDWKDMMKDMDQLLEDGTEVLEDEYFGKHLKVSYKITDKEKASKKMIRTIEKEYDDVKKAYKLKVELTVEGKDEEITSKATVYSVKLDDGWVLYVEDGALSSLAEDFEEPIDAAGSKLTKLITKALSEMGLGGLGAMDLDF